MYFVSFWKHGIKFLISQWAIPLVNLSLPAPSLQLFWSHAHQVTCKHWKHYRSPKKNITFNNNRNNQHYWSSTWSGCGHIHSRCAQRGFSRGEQRSWRAHLTGWCFIPSWLPLASTWGGGLTHWLISSVCTWSLSPATAMTRCLWNTQIKII